MLKEKRDSDHLISAEFRNNVESLFIMKPDNLGDLILFSGCLKPLRDHFPNAKITICIQRYADDYLRYSPYVDHIVYWDSLKKIQVPLISGIRGLWRIENWIQSISLWLHSSFSCPSQVVLLPVRSPNALMHRYTALSGSMVKAGIKGDALNVPASQLDRLTGHYTHLLTLDESTTWNHEFDVYLAFLKLFNIRVTKEDIRPSFWTLPSDKKWAEKVVSSKEGVINLAISPGVSSLTEKFYAPHRYREALSMAPYRYAVTIFGGRSEMDQCKELEEELKRCEQVLSITNVAGNTTIGELIEGVRNSDMVISLETATLHIATGLGVPVIGIVGGGHYGRFYPWGDPSLSRSVHLPMECYHCNWNCIFDRMKCIHDIPASHLAREINHIAEKHISTRKKLHR